MSVTLEKLIALLPDARRTASGGYSARCPAHDDRQASLSVSMGEDGKVLIYCHAGCPTETVVSALRLTMADLMPPKDERPAPSGQRRIVATYDYHGTDGQLGYQVVRYEPKDFRQRRPKSGGGWEWGTKGIAPLPYRLPELQAEPQRPVIVVEGEKDADRLAKAGLLATCNHGGAGKWTGQHAEHLRGRCVVVVPDGDAPGKQHAEQVAQSLQGIAKWVRVVELPGLPPKGDVSDWLDSGGTKDKLRQLIEATPNWVPREEPWPELTPFGTMDLPRFPVDALPLVLRDWVEAESHATQTPADLAALLSLAVCAACVAKRVEVEPRPGWREPVNLFVAVLLDPSNRKSAVFTDALCPLKEVEEEQDEAARPSVARAQSERRQAEARLRKLEKKAAEKDDIEARHEAGELAEQLALMPIPSLPRRVIDDATSEKVAMLLEQQGGRIASMSPEGGVFDLMAGLYSKSGMPQFGVYLMGHAGDDIVVDRVSRDSVRIPKPALTCGYAIQEAVIKGLAENAAFRGRGLLARFLYAFPESLIGRREIGADPVPEPVQAAYHRVVRSLAELEGESVLSLTAPAIERFRDWEIEVESMLGDGGAMEMFRDWGGKLAGATLRLAAVIHCAEHGPGRPIGQEIITAAISIARYLIPHAEATLALMTAGEDSGADGAQYVLRWIVEHKRREFTQRDVHRHGQRRFAKSEDVVPALNELEQRGYIRKRVTPAEGPGRTPSPSYETNPAIFDSPESADTIDRISDAPTGRGDCVNSVNAFERFEIQNTNRVRVSL